MPRTLATVRQLATNRVLAVARVLATNRTIPSGLVLSLVAYWKLEELSGIRVDATMRGNDLTDVNTVTQNPGKVGDAAQFTAANSERLSHVDNADLSMGNLDFTIAGWVYLDSKPANVMGIYSKSGLGSTAAGQNEFFMRWNNATDRFNFAISDGTTVTTRAASSFGAPPLSTWCFIVAWYDATANTVNIQVNNGTVDSTAQSTGSWDSGFAFYIGEAPANLYWDGRIDEVGIWKRVLTAAERTALYNAGVGRTYPFLGT